LLLLFLITLLGTKVRDKSAMRR